MHYLDFEQTLSEVDAKIEALNNNQVAKGKNKESELERLAAKRIRVLKQTYRHLSPWQKACVARHEDRPHTEIT